MQPAMVDVGVAQKDRLAIMSYQATIHASQLQGLVLCGECSQELQC